MAFSCKSQMENSIYEIDHFALSMHQTLFFGTIDLLTSVHYPSIKHYFLAHRSFDFGTIENLRPNFFH